MRHALRTVACLLSLGADTHWSVARPGTGTATTLTFFLQLDPMVQRTRLLLNLTAFSHTHDWLPRGSGVAFRSVCERAGVSRIGFLRHGNTAPKPENGLDFDRLLTSQGREQAKEAGDSFGKESKPFFPSVLVSPSPRTTETAEIFLKASDASSSCVVEPVQSLYDGTMHPKGSQIFQQIGYAPLTDYVDSSDSEDREMARSLFGLYATTVIDVMKNSLIDSSKDGSGDNLTLWMVGHAIYLPAAALGVASLVDCSDRGLETIMSSNTKEAEGYLIDIANSEAVYLSRPSQQA